ncbi:hypothetical protein GWN42_24875 [candidate division KSB1 bacterium]|nr:hypothetical protein [candidate division KSB1 bacterium]
MKITIALILAVLISLIDSPVFAEDVPRGKAAIVEGEPMRCYTGDEQQKIASSYSDRKKLIRENQLLNKELKLQTEKIDLFGDQAVAYDALVIEYETMVEHLNLEVTDLDKKAQTMAITSIAASTLAIALALFLGFEQLGGKN